MTTNQEKEPEVIPAELLALKFWNAFMGEAAGTFETQTDAVRKRAIEAMGDALRELSYRDVPMSIKRAARKYCVMAGHAWQAMLFAASNLRKEDHREIRD